MQLVKSNSPPYTLLYIQNKKKKSKQKTMAGLYIHIPFCESRCIYCGFFSTTSLDKRDAYVDALCREMKLRPVNEALGEPHTLSTVYLGGGTPSMLTPGQLSRLFQGIDDAYGDVLEADAEVTMECNPDDVSSLFCDFLRQWPVNRISMGAQTFSDERLHFLHRRHKAEDVREAVIRLRDAGISNISIDLMFGFPGETLHDWQRDIDEALSLDVEHLSAYSLMYEEGTQLYQQLQKGKIKEIDEETYRSMYELLIDRLTAAGYEHYEISNFARPGRQSRHNSSYWDATPYIGIGAGAHSYKRTPQVVRSWNIANIPSYTSQIMQGTLPSEGETLDKATQYNDLITTTLRTRQGISLEQMEHVFGTTYLSMLLKEAERHIHQGTMKKENGSLSLTRNGLYVSDDIMADFMLV